MLNLPPGKQAITNANATSAGSGSALESVWQGREGKEHFQVFDGHPTFRPGRASLSGLGLTATFDAGLSDFAHIKEELEP